MKKNCAKGHTMEDTHQRCPDCGGERAADDQPMAKAVCGGCGTEAPGTQKFCVECGDPMLKAEQIEADLAAALDDLDVIAKANTGLPETVTPPAVDKDDAELANLLKAAEDGTIDAGPILEAIRLSQNQVVATNLASATETRATRRELGTFLKSYVARERGRDRSIAMLKSTIDGLEATVAKLSGTPHGHRSRLSITEQPRQGAGDGDEKPVTMPRDVFMAKAHVAHDNGKLTIGDLAQVETWVNQGPNGLAMMNAADPALYTKCIQAIGEITQ